MYLCNIWLFVFTLIISVLTNTKSVTPHTVLTVIIDDNLTPCSSFKAHAVNETLSYLITCTETLPNENCRLAFFGLGEDYLDRYQVCISPLSYNISDCSSSMTYEFTQVMTVTETYEFNCSHSPYEVCAGVGQYIVISFSSGSNPLYSSFQLKINGTKTFDNSPISDDKNINYGTVAGGIVGGIIVFSICFVISVVSVCRWRATGTPNSSKRDSKVAF